MSDFDPRYPPTTNSLNRLRLEAAAMPDAVRGKGGYELVSAQALNTLIQPYTSDLPTFYEQAALDAGWAVEIAQTLGTRLGCLVLALVRNDAQTRQANPDKPTDYWTYWSGVQTIYLGGGLVSGRAGEIITAQAQATLQSLANDPGYCVSRADHPQYLPLMGAARVVQSGSRASVLDFGGSYVKRGIAHYAAGKLNHMQILDSLPTDFPTASDDAQIIFDRMVDIIVQSYGEADAPTIPISIASYVDKRGQPLLSQGGTYMQLARLTTNAPAMLSQTVSDRLGKPVEIKLLHDGTAASLYFAPMDHAAVIMLGTAIGSGYPLARPGLTLCPVLPMMTLN